MKHPSALLSAFLDGELNPVETAQLHGHLSSCGRCVAELEEVQKVRAAIRSLPLIELPVDLAYSGEPNVVPIRRHRYLVAGAAAVVAVVVAIAAIFSPAQGTISGDDLTRSYTARASMDPAFGPAKLPPAWDLVQE